MGEGNYEFGLGKYFCSYLQVVFLHARKSYDMGLQLYFPSKEGVMRIFIALKMHNLSQI
jgi:hypothetical protein